MKLVKYIALVLFVCCLCDRTDVLFAIQPQKKNLPEMADCPTIDESNVKIIHPDCGKTNGGITGINITSSGTKVLYKWRNANGFVVGTSKDLSGVGVDYYTLEVTDNSGCRTTVFSSEIKVALLNEITIDESNAAVIAASCDQPGAITGIMVKGATTYTWKEAISGITYTSTTTADLLKAIPGHYQLTASNSTSACDKFSNLYVVNGDFVVPQVISFSIDSNQYCGKPVSISVTINPQKDGPQLYYYWKDSLDNVVDNNMLVKGISPITIHLKNQPKGKFTLFLQSDKHCPVALGSYRVKPTQIVIDSAKSAIYNDVCNQHLGAIVPDITNVLPGAPPKITWFSNGQVVSHSKSIFRVGKGRYYLLVEAGGCITLGTFDLTDDSPALVQPVANGSTICLPGLIGIKVTNPDTAGIFRLYANENDTTPIDSNVTGEFYKNIKKSTDFYVARAHGRCESVRTKVSEIVLAELDIPNTFTPNNDGVNDTWQISGIEAFPKAEISVFDRYGHNVYQSVGYSSPFDGRKNGRPLAAGAYYYVIDTKQFICYGKISGSLTILY